MKRFIALIAVIASFVMVGSASAATNPKALAGTFLGQSMTAVEYNHKTTARVGYNARGFVNSIATNANNATYDGLREGQFIPLGKCIKINNSCAYRFKNYWWDPNNHAWMREVNNIFTMIHVENGKIYAFEIDDWRGCKVCRVTPFGVVLD